MMKPARAEFNRHADDGAPPAADRLAMESGRLPQPIRPTDPGKPLWQPGRHNTATGIIGPRIQDFSSVGR